jgi:hypothetical protein
MPSGPILSNISEVSELILLASTFPIVGAGNDLATEAKGAAVAELLVLLATNEAGAAAADDTDEVCSKEGALELG